MKTLQTYSDNKNTIYITECCTIRVHKTRIKEQGDTYWVEAVPYIDANSNFAIKSYVIANNIRYVVDAHDIAQKFIEEHDGLEGIQFGYDVKRR